MTVQRLRSKMRRLREHGEEMLEESGELNVVPYLDIVMNIIMFLLVTVTFSAAMGHINVNTPTTATVGLGDQQEERNKPELNLTVSISERGFTIAASGGVLYEGWTWGPEGLVQTTNNIPTIPLRGTEYDYARLTQQMAIIKSKYPDETKVIINANPQITYDKVVATMDAIRNDGPRVLFPDVLLSAGVN
ncbi:MAG: biopolymer transporter ExbD [Myxococcota bacterium]|nr:biopolymer transporter ExbD [Myxococcota bacterium]